jgi:enoyl-CoA hydratase
VHLEFDGPVAIVTTSNPPAELFDEAQISGLLDAIAETTRVGARAMVIKSDAPAFSGGADVNAFVDKDRSEAHDFLGNAMKVIWALEDAPFPIVAAVNGFCFAAGLELALACDFIYASDRARFGQPEVNLGLLPGFGGTQRLARRVGLGHARELVYTGRHVTAEQALALGLVNQVVPHAELRQQVRQVATEIAAKAPLAIAAAKRVMARGYDASLDTACELEATAFATLFASTDMREGTSAFLAKRKPEFKGH